MLHIQTVHYHTPTGVLSVIVSHNIMESISDLQLAEFISLAGDRRHRVNIGQSSWKIERIFVWVVHCLVEEHVCIPVSHSGLRVTGVS